MDKAERAKRLRKGFKANGGIPFPACVNQSLIRTTPIPNKGSGKALLIHYGVSGPGKRPEWVSKVNPTKASKWIRYATKESPLTRIARVLPMKLKPVLDRRTGKAIVEPCQSGQATLTMPIRLRFR